MIVSLRNNLKTKLNSSVKLLTTGYLCIGFHQLFEYLSILTGNQIVYKTGLLFSISSMFFNIKSLEVLTRKKHGSSLVLLIIILLAIYLYFFKIMNFQNEHFYVRGEDHFLWGSLWMLFFLYWNFSYLFYYKKVKDKNTKKFLLKAPLYSLNISFLLATIYSYSAGLLNNFFTFPENGLSNFCGGIFTNFEIVFDAPSIWCAFAAIQGFFIMRLFKQYCTNPDSITPELENVEINTLLIFSLSVVCVFIIFLTLPLFSALSYKMILK